MINKIVDILDKDMKKTISQTGPKTKKYIEALKEVEAFKQQAVDKQKKSLERIKELDKEISKLDERYLGETDEKKMNAIMKEKKQLIIERESERGINSTDFKQLVINRLNAIEGYRVEARIERDNYIHERDHKEKEYDALIDEINERIRVLSRAHPYNGAERIRERILEPPYQKERQSKAAKWS